MNKQEQQRSETLASILAEAEKLFAAKGYAATSVQDILNECGLSKGAFYHYFSSKEDVLEQLCRDHYEGMKHAVMPVISDTSIFYLEKIAEIISISRNHSLGKKNFINEYLSIRHRSGDEILKSRLASYDKLFYLEVIAPVLEDARKDGFCSFDGDAEIIALLIFTIDKGVTEEIDTILAEKAEDAEPRMLRLMQGLVYAVSNLLHVSEQEIHTIVNPEQSVTYLMQILQNEGAK